MLDEIKFRSKLKTLIRANQPQSNQLFRTAIHAIELIPGVKTADLALTLSVFMYDAKTILPIAGARIKTSLWRRTADTAIPARAKVNGVYVNSALAKQDALDAGFDDCLFLNHNVYVSELSAANIFMVKQGVRGVLITPYCFSDILEGITRRTVIEIAHKLKLKVVERKVALTELYTADEVFACGTSAHVTPIIELDGRIIDSKKTGNLTKIIRHELQKLQNSKNNLTAWL